MSKPLTAKALAGATLVLAVALTGCAAQSDNRGAAAQGSAASEAVAAPAGAEALLAEHGLDGMTTVEIIDSLDRLGQAERPRDLMASVRPGELMLNSDTEEFSLDVPKGQFYLSVAPYVARTHDCYNHSLTTCTGELAATEVQVQIVDNTNDKVLVDESRTTFENGFTGFWLPRDIEGTLRVSYDGKAGETDFATNEDAPTCLTTLKLT